MTQQSDARTVVAELPAAPGAAVLAAAGRIELRELEVREPGEGEVRVRLEGSGVCASNLAPWEGAPWFEYPFAPGEPGHEGWGVVERVGGGVREVAEGDRVATLASGAFATHQVVDAAQVVPIPEGLRGVPVPGEPLGCAMNVFRRSAIEPGQTVAIVGAGFMGLLLTQLVTAAGGRVIAISRRPFSLEAARSMGAEETIEMDDHWRILERVRELTGSRLCDRVIEAVGKQWPLDLAGELTREGGRLVIAGYHQDGPRQVNMQLWNWRGIDVINAHERDPRVVVEGTRAAVRAVAEGRLDPSPLYTHRFPLEKLADALDTTRDRPDGFLKALVVNE